MLWDARFSTPLAHAGILNGRVVGPFRPTDRIISPASRTNSMIYFRVSDSGPAKMPPWQVPKPIAPLWLCWRNGFLGFHSIRGGRLTSVRRVWLVREV